MYVFHLDDDDYLADNDVLRTLEQVTKPWAIFPVLREGFRLYFPQPGFCRTTISSYILQSRVANKVGFPAGPQATDSKFVENVLVPNYEFERLDHVRPLVVIERVSAGEEEHSMHG